MLPLFDNLCLLSRMRRLTAFAALLAAGCATAPTPPRLPPTAGPSPTVPRPSDNSGGLIGLTAADLYQRFGQPALQVREGPGLKLQYRGRACVLDTYLYPPERGQGPDRVVHVDTRLSSGIDTPQPGCIATLQRT